MTTPISLRPLTLADVTERYLDWLRDPRVTASLTSGHVPQTLDTLRAFVAQLQWPTAAAFAICDADGTHVGNVMLRTIAWIPRHAEVGILVGESARWRQGIGRAAVQQITRYAFETLQLRRVWAGTCNPACGALFASLGWTHEGTQRAHSLVGGQWRDHALYGLLAPDAPSAPEGLTPSEDVTQEAPMSRHTPRDTQIPTPTPPAGYADWLDDLHQIAAQGPARLVAEQTAYRTYLTQSPLATLGYARVSRVRRRPTGPLDSGPPDE